MAADRYIGVFFVIANNKYWHTGPAHSLKLKTAVPWLAGLSSSRCAPTLHRIAKRSTSVRLPPTIPCTFSTCIITTGVRGAGRLTFSE